MLKDQVLPLQVGQGHRRCRQFPQVYEPTALGDKDFEIHIQESASSLSWGLSVWEQRAILWSSPCLSPVLGSHWGSHISVQRGGDPPCLGPAASCLRSSCPAKAGRNCSAKQKKWICPNFSAGTQSFHHQETLIRPGLEILSEAGGSARSPCRTRLVTVGTPSPPLPSPACL